MAFEVYENDKDWAAAQKVKQDDRANREDWVNVKYKFNLGTTKFRPLGRYSPNPGTGWFARTLEHYEPVGKSVVCPQLADMPCPICEESQRLFDAGDQERGKKLRPSQRFWINALILEEQNARKAGAQAHSAKDGIFAFKVPTSVLSFLLDMDTDFASGYGDITDLEHGWDVIVEKAQGFRPDAYTSKLFAKPTNIVQQLADQGIDITTFNLVNLDELVVPMSYDELSELVNGKQEAAASTTPTVQPVKLSTSSPVKVEESQPAEVSSTPMTQVRMVSPKPVPAIPKPPMRPGVK